MRDSATAINLLREFGLTLPGAHLKSPWPNHKDLAVNDKTFAYLPADDSSFSISCRLDDSLADALEMSITAPAGYGLGKWGWVEASIEDGDIPVELFKTWIEESYRRQAPKKFLKLLNAAE